MSNATKTHADFEAAYEQPCQPDSPLNSLNINATRPFTWQESTQGMTAATQHPFAAFYMRERDPTYYEFNRPKGSQLSAKEGQRRTDIFNQRHAYETYKDEHGVIRSTGQPRRVFRIRPSWEGKRVFPSYRLLWNGEVWNLHAGRLAWGLQVAIRNADKGTWYPNQSTLRPAMLHPLKNAPDVEPEDYIWWHENLHYTNITTQRDNPEPTNLAQIRAAAHTQYI